MTRLNKTIREAIVDNAISKSGVTTREKSLIERRAKLAEDVRLFAIGGAEKEAEILATFEKIKNYINKNKHELIEANVSLLSRDDEVYCNFSGRSVNLSFHGGRCRSDKRNIYKNLVMSVHGKRVVITADNPLNAEFNAIEAEQKIIDDLRVSVRSEVYAIVSSVTTIKKLIEIWPECKELLPPEERPQSTALVANVDNLNTIIGLPTE